MKICHDDVIHFCLKIVEVVVRSAFFRPHVIFGVLGPNSRVVEAAGKTLQS